MPCPFRQARSTQGTAPLDDQGDPLVLLLRLKDVRQAAHQYERFSSEARPGRIVVPSEVNIRDIRQLPFELDPPRHTSWRALVEDWFERPDGNAYQQALDALVGAAVDGAIGGDRPDIVHDFALPLQSRALALLLNVPRAEAETWIGWGTHVFRSPNNPLDGGKASVLYDYLDRAIERAAADPADDFYGLLLRARIDGRPLTREEIKGVLVLTFAGGRDTVINAVTNICAYFADHPEALDRLRQAPWGIPMAVEELLRYFAPLTQMGRVVTEDTEVAGCPVAAGSRISLVWASANRDETVFERPDEIVLDRRMNPHLTFGFSHHNCLGATHARALLRTLVTVLAERVAGIDLHERTENVEKLGTFRRPVGYHRLVATFRSR